MHLIRREFGQFHDGHGRRLSTVTALGLWSFGNLLFKTRVSVSTQGKQVNGSIEVLSREDSAPKWNHLWQQEQYTPNRILWETDNTHLVDPLPADVYEPVERHLLEIATQIVDGV